MVFLYQPAQLPQADPDRGVRYHILIFPVDRIAGPRRRRIQQGDHMKRFRMYEHTEDRRRNDRPVIGIFQKKFYHRGLIQIDMGWNGGAEPVIMPVIVLESPGKDMLYCSQSTPD